MGKDKRLCKNNWYKSVRIPVPQKPEQIIKSKKKAKLEKILEKEAEDEISRATKGMETSRGKH